MKTTDELIKEGLENLRVCVIADNDDYHDTSLEASPESILTSSSMMDLVALIKEIAKAAKEEGRREERERIVEQYGRYLALNKDWTLKGGINLFFNDSK